MPETACAAPRGIEMTPQTQDSLNYIGGRWRPSGSNRLIESVDPATSEIVGRASPGSSLLADEAARAARSAFEKSLWQGSPRLRAEILLEFAARLEDRKKWLSELIVRENGKIRAQAIHEISAGCSEAKYYAGLARSVFGRTTETGPGNFSFLTREPAGVVAVVVPWNAPVTLLVRSVAPALAAGCSVVVKPAPQTPLVNSEVIRCFDEIENLPAGVVNSVNENGVEVADALVTHPEVDVISFTGSSKTGKIVMEKAAAGVKRVSLELGGKSPAIVFDDADMDAAIAEIRRAAIALTGQMCTAVSRVLVQESAAREFGRRLKAEFESVKVGNGLSAGIEMGPLIDRANQQRVLRIVERAGIEGELILRGRVPEGDLATGAFVTPTIFRIDDVEHPLIQEELFGPIVSLETFADETDAIGAANSTKYGLAASVYTGNIGRAMRLSRKLKFGTVWINSHNRLFAEAETGGYRESGIGRLHGVEGLNDFLETKHIYVEAGSS